MLPAQVDLLPFKLTEAKSLQYEAVAVKIETYILLCCLQLIKRTDRQVGLIDRYIQLICLFYFLTRAVGVNGTMRRPSVVVRHGCIVAKR